MLKQLFALLVSASAVLWISGCGGGKPADPAKKETGSAEKKEKEGDHGHAHDDHDHAHDEEGPHGGELQEIGDHAAHLEIKHDHENGKSLLFVLDKDLKPLPVAKPKVTVMTEKGPEEVEVKAVEEADGKAWKYEAAHEAFKKDPINGQVELSIGGQNHKVKLDPHFKG